MTAQSAPVFFSHFFRLREHILKVFPDIVHRLLLEQKTPVLKMMIQAPVVQIDRSAGRNGVIRDGHLAVAEARRILIDPHTVLHQSRVVGSGHGIDQLLVGNPRCYDPDIHAVFRSHAQHIVHLVRDNQIRRDEPGIFFRAAGNCGINTFPDMLALHRAVRVGLHNAAFPGLIVVNLQIPAKVLVVDIISPDGIPHFKKCDRKAPHGVTLEPNARILPVSVRMCQVKVFIRKIVPACEPDLSVNDRDLSVIPVIQENVQARSERIEHAAFDSLLIHTPDKIRGDESDAPHVIIEKTYFNALLHLRDENFLDAVEGLGILYGMVFHENEILRLPHLTKLCLKAVARFGIIFHIRIPVRRISGILFHIGRHPAERHFLFGHAPGQITVMSEFRQKYCVDSPESFPHPCRVRIQTDQQIKRKAEKRREKDQYDPWHFDRC